MGLKIFLFFGASTLSFAATYTVSTSPDLHAKFALLQPGDTLSIAAGTYDSCNLYTQTAGLPGAPIVVQGAGEKLTVLDQGNDTAKSIAAGGWKGSLLNLRHGYWIVEKLQLRNSFDCVVHIVNFAPHCILRDMEWTRWGGFACKTQVKFWDLVGDTLIQSGADSLLIENIHAHLNQAPSAYRGGGDIIDILGSDGVLMRNNYFVCDYLNYTGFVKGNSSGSIFENNLVKDGGAVTGYGVGWSLGGGLTGKGKYWFKFNDETWEARNSLVRNNVFINMADYCVHTNQALNTRVYHNTFVASSAGDLLVLQVKPNSSGVELKNSLYAGAGSPGRSGTRTEANNVTTAGLTFFVNAAGEDFRLKPGTAAVNACPPLAEVKTDFNGFTRDNQPDAGAFEYGTAVAQEASAAPIPLMLSSCPNPGRETIRLNFLVSNKENFGIDIFSPDGRRLQSLTPARLLYGVNTVEWNGRDNAGRPLPSGVYLVSLRAGTRREVRQVVYGK